MKAKSSSYWKNKKVLVTGADGFMGSHLTERLLEAGANVSILVRGTSVSGTYKYELKNIPHLRKDLTRIIAVNISSPDTIPLIAKLSPTVIFIWRLTLMYLIPSITPLK